MKYPIFACASGAALLLSTPALADAADMDASGTVILVTATRIPADLAQLSSAITVIDKAALDRGQDMSVSEILLRTPSISLHRNGGYGTSTSLRIRGAESDHTVLVIDGVKLNDPSATGGGYNFGHLMLGDAAQIEILRGPQSILWGSQAIGGVVNIRTSLPDAPLGGSFDIEAGSHGTINARIGAGGKTGDLRWRIAAQNFVTDGISAIAPEFGGIEKDGYRNTNVSGRGTWSISDTVSLDFGGFYSDAKVDIDSTSADTPEYSRNQEWLAHLAVNWTLMDGRFHNRVMLQYTDSARDNYNPTRARPQSFDASGNNRRAEYQGRFTWNDAVQIVFGADHEQSEFLSRSPAASLSIPLPDFAQGSADITGFYGQALLQPVMNLHLDIGVRHDDHSNYGGQTLFGAGARYALPTGTTVRASYGEGFKAPSLYQLYSEFGNDSLSPETAWGWDVGVEQKLLRDTLKLAFNWFERTTKNQIIYNPCTAPSTNGLCSLPNDPDTFRYGYYSNVSRSKAHGLEAEASLSLGRLDLAGNYSWILAEDRSLDPEKFGKWLLRRPRETANISANYRTSFGMDVGAAVRFAGKSFDNANNSRVLNGYELVDLRAEMPVSSKVSVFARAENIFDTQYMTVYRYGTLGRSLYAGLRGRF